MKPLVLPARLIFGAWMLISGINHFFVQFYPMSVGHDPLAVQLMTALVHSRLLDVALAVQLIAGLLILAGVLVPVALCVVMPVSVCAAYWAVILERAPIGAVLALVAVALNALLLLVYLDHYRDMLHRRALAAGEGVEDGANYEATFAYPVGRISGGRFIGALITLLLAFAFYHFFVRGPSGWYGMLVMLYPALVLLGRRLQDMGRGRAEPAAGA